MCSTTHPSPVLTERTLARSEPGADAPHVAHRLRFAPSDAVRPDCKFTASALFGPRTSWEAGLRPDSPALPPLHSTPRPLINEASSRCVRSDGRKLARQSKTFVRAQDARHQRPRCSACRPSHRNKAARLRPANASALVVSPASFRGRETGRLHSPNQFRLTLRRHASRGTPERAHAPSRRSSRAPLCRRRVSATWPRADATRPPELFRRPGFRGQRLRGGLA